MEFRYLTFLMLSLILISCARSEENIQCKYPNPIKYFQNEDLKCTIDNENPFDVIYFSDYKFSDIYTGLSFYYSQRSRVFYNNDFYVLGITIESSESLIQNDRSNLLLEYHFITDNETSQPRLFSAGEDEWATNIPNNEGFTHDGYSIHLSFLLDVDFFEKLLTSESVEIKSELFHLKLTDSQKRDLKNLQLSILSNQR